MPKKPPSKAVTGVKSRRDTPALSDAYLNAVFGPLTRDPSALCAIAALQEAATDERLSAMQSAIASIKPVLSARELRDTVVQDSSPFDDALPPEAVEKMARSSDARKQSLITFVGIAVARAFLNRDARWLSDLAGLIEKTRGKRVAMYSPTDALVIEYFLLKRGLHPKLFDCYDEKTALAEGRGLREMLNRPGVASLMLAGLQSQLDADRKKASRPVPRDRVIVVRMTTREDLCAVASDVSHYARVNGHSLTPEGALKAMKRLGFPSTSPGRPRKQKKAN